MKVAIVGSRSFTNYRIVEQYVKKCVPLEYIEEVVSGGAKGADTLARKFANMHGVPINEILPDWDTYGKRAGYLRNEKIVS